MSSDGTVGVSEDVGRTWPTLQHVDPQLTSMVTFGNGLILIGGYTTPDSNGYNSLISAVSDDFGKTWSPTKTIKSGYWLSWQGLVFNGAQFIGWSGGERLTSVDGLNWTAMPITQGFASGRLVYHPATATYVDISNSGFYANQKAYTSTDGLTWTELDTNHFKGGHPIGSMVVGEVDSSACSSP